MQDVSVSSPTVKRTSAPTISPMPSLGINGLVLFFASFSPACLLIICSVDCLCCYYLQTVWNLSLTRLHLCVGREFSPSSRIHRTNLNFSVSKMLPSVGIKGTFYQGFPKCPMIDWSAHHRWARQLPNVRMPVFLSLGLLIISPEFFEVHFAFSELCAVKFGVHATPG